MAVTRELTIAAHYNVDSNLIRVQLYVTDMCDNGRVFYPQDVLSATVQLFNVFTTPETGLQEIPLEKVEFNKDYANADGFFLIFFINPAVNVNLEARAVVTTSQGVLSAGAIVLPDEGTFSDQPSTSVVGNAENRHWHLDKEAERDGQGLDQAPHNIPELVDNAVVTVDAVDTLNADIQFEQLAEMKSSNALTTGTLVYLGGGNRLLPKPGQLVLQNIDVPPWELGASTFVEAEATELLPNNTYTEATGFPNGYTIESPSISVLQNNLQTLQGEGFNAKAWSLQISGAVPANITPFSKASIGLDEPVPFDITKPLALNLLAGMEKNTDDSSISEARLLLTFHDFADRPITSKIKVLNPDDLFNARPLKPFSVQAFVSDYPPTTEKVTWRLEIGSVDQGDILTVRTALPSLLQLPFATSAVLSGNTRAKDNLSFAPTEAYPLAQGAAVVGMAVGWDDAPTEIRYILDSRDPASLDKGVSLRVETDGNLTLSVHGDVATATLSTTTPPTWVSGAITELVAEWRTTPSLLRLTVDGTVVAEDTSTALPTDVGTLEITSIQIGSDVAIANHADSEFIRTVFLKVPR